MKVLMHPSLRSFRAEESGIKNVVENYHRYLPDYGVEYVDGDSYDLVAVHAGSKGGCDVAHNHGLYWTADYPAVSWEWAVNRDVMNALRSAREITVPSEWVAETIRRDLRRIPHVIPHGIDWAAWQHNEPQGDYLLWAKNRMSDVCDPSPMEALARKFPKGHFVTTFATKRKPDNVNEIGMVPHDAMMQLVQSSLVYLSTVKETFGIGILEAMASGVPVLGYGHGGILDLVEHGVNGYLANSGSQEDLEQGLQYCLKHRETLGANGKEMARRFTWEKVAEQVAGVYREAVKTERARVDVVIPTYNYEHMIERAVRSVLGQTFADFEVFVVDDGSMDGTESVVMSIDDRRVHYARQDNAGVARARNNGISQGSAPFVCCLDADDAIEPRFLETCVNALMEDNSLGIAYTGLRYVLPDGKEGMSPWPGQWDYDKQLRRQNQVPTCCVFRRDMWESLGGYRSRYCPDGAGSEDADFWTRCGAYGWKAEKVSNVGLFTYSWQSGQVSGDPQYSEADWLAWHPWAKDNLHPVGSYAKPRRFSHPARQYDEPIVSVIIPVGPGHESQVINALDSLDAQTFRKWEAIAVWDGTETPERIEKAFPHVRHVTVSARSGPGFARNLGAESSRAPLLLFLDADDWLHPDALDKMVGAWEDAQACVYTDYLGRAFISDVEDLAPDLRKRILHRDGDETVIRYHASDYDWERAQRQPEDPPYIWCNITTLVPKEWHNGVGGFDEGMRSWEDWDYWCRLARAGRPFVRVPEPLLMYLFYSGGRRDEGARSHAELFAYLKGKYEGVDAVPCKGCGRSRVSNPRRVTIESSPLLDDDFVIARYTHANRGSHPVVGPPVHEQRVGGLHCVRDGRTKLYRIHYGYRAGGDRFLAHKRDVEAWHLLQEVRTVEEPTPEPPPPPQEMPAEPTILDVRETLERLIDDGSPQETLERLDTIPDHVFDLQKLPGITDQIARQLEASGVTSRDGILALGMEGLQELKGVGPVKAETLIGVLSA